MKQSSIDFLAEKHDKLVRWMEGDAKAEPYSFTNFSNDLNIARQMHREEVQESYFEGLKDTYQRNYYEETFNTQNNG